MYLLIIIMGDSKILFCSLKFPTGTRMDSSKFIDNLGTLLHSISPDFLSSSPPP